MKFVLLWVLMTASGGVSSGSAAFADLASCEQAIAKIETSARLVAKSARQPEPSVAAACQPISAR